MTHWPKGGRRPRPCPFCGGTETKCENGGPGAVWITCIKCGAAGAAVVTRSGAISKWNKRVDFEGAPAVGEFLSDHCPWCGSIDISAGDVCMTNAGAWSAVCKCGGNGPGETFKRPHAQEWRKRKNVAW